MRLHGVADDAARAVARDLRPSRYGFAEPVTVDVALAEGDVVEAGGAPPARRVPTRAQPHGHALRRRRGPRRARRRPPDRAHLLEPARAPPARRARRPAAPLLRRSARTSTRSRAPRRAAPSCFSHGPRRRDPRPTPALIAERDPAPPRPSRPGARRLARRAGPAARASCARPLAGRAVSQTYLTLCEVLGALDLLERGGPGRSRPRGETLVYERVDLPSGSPRRTGRGWPWRRVSGSSRSISRARSASSAVPQRGVAARPLGRDRLRARRPRGVGAPRRRDPVRGRERGALPRASPSGAGAGPRAPGTRSSSEPAADAARPSRRDPAAAGSPAGRPSDGGRSPQPAARAPRREVEARAARARGPAFAGEVAVSVDPRCSAVHHHHRPRRASRARRSSERCRSTAPATVLVARHDVLGVERAEAAPDGGAEVVERIARRASAPSREAR